jgi:hypothetical protein
MMIKLGEMLSAMSNLGDNCDNEYANVKGVY